MSIEAMKQSLEAKQTPLIELLERVPADARMVYEHDQFHSENIPVGRLCHEAAAALRAAIEQGEKQNERIASLENTCYALIGKLQVANLKLAFRDLRPELEHHAARILNEEFGEKK